MKTIRVFINYLFVLSLPLWGPAIIIKHHRNSHYWNSWTEIGERALEMLVCAISPIFLLLFLFVLRFTKVSGFNKHLQDPDKLGNDSVQNLLEAFKYGNHWAWQVFPDAYDVENQRKHMVRDFKNSIRKMSIIALGKDVVPSEDQNGM